jgi:hypothetical protein
MLIHRKNTHLHPDCLLNFDKTAIYTETGILIESVFAAALVERNNKTAD